MARDRKRAKQRQRRAAQRKSQPARRGRPPKDEAAEGAAAAEANVEPDRDHTIADLDHGSSGADIAKAAIAAGSVNPAEVSEELDDEVGHDPRKGEIFEDEVVDDGYDDEESEIAAEGADGAAAATIKPRRREREREPAAKSGNRLTRFLRNSWEELKRVQWPDRRQVAQATGVVIVFVVIIGLYLGAADYVFSKLVDAII